MSRPVREPTNDELGAACCLLLLPFAVPAGFMVLAAVLIKWVAQ